MLETPQIVQTPSQIAAVIRVTIPRDQIGTVMGPAIGEVIAAVTSQGIGPVGPVFSRHFNLEPDTFDFDVGVPVKAPVTPVGRVKAGELPAATVVRTVYQGPYEGLGEAWGEFMGWIKTQGYSQAPGIWERYLSGPESGGDSSTFRTELNRPLASEACPA